MKTTNGLIIGLLVVLTACNNPTEKENAATEVKNETMTTKENPAPSPGISETCAFVLPSGIMEQVKGQYDNVDHPIQTDSICMVMFTKKSTKAELTFTAERSTDTSLLERKVRMFENIPGFIGKIDAGDIGNISRQPGSAVDIYTVVFKVGNYGCSIVSQMKKDMDPSEGILFEEEKLIETAMAWANQLKDLQK